MIEVDSLTRRYGETYALSNVSFSVAAGEIVGFLGPNGAGKTTAMRILTCTLAPTAGVARVGGHDVTRAPLAVRSQVGFMPENISLYPDNRVHEFLRFVARLKGVPGARLKKHLADIVGQTGLAEVENRLVAHLSKGFRQRLGLAQALVGDPEILILDEPSAGLDPHQNVEIRQLIHDFRGRKTVLLSSHILSEVSLTCQRVLILDRGRLVAEEDPQILALHSGSWPQVTLRWDGVRDEVYRALAALEGVAEVIATAAGADVSLRADPRQMRPQLAAAVIGAGGSLQGMTDRVVSLEDLFLRLTGDRISSGSRRGPAGPDEREETEQGEGT